MILVHELCDLLNCFLSVSPKTKLCKYDYTLHSYIVNLIQLDGTLYHIHLPQYTSITENSFINVGNVQHIFLLLLLCTHKYKQYIIHYTNIHKNIFKNQCNIQHKSCTVIFLHWKRRLVTFIYLDNEGDNALTLFYRQYGLFLIVLVLFTYVPAIFVYDGDICKIIKNGHFKRNN